MKEVSSLSVLKKELKSNQNVWLMLFKKGSEQSDCAFNNFLVVSQKKSADTLLYADVNIVRDIHPVYSITSVPTLLQFKKGELVNSLKGCNKTEQFQAILENSVFKANDIKDSEKIKRVTVYTTPACSWCNSVKRHLDANGIHYREIDVMKDQKAAEEMIRKSGQQGVPQTDIDGKMIVGFDRVKINNLLGIN
jgi:glutaredoxin-like YruB-family protein